MPKVLLVSAVPSRDSRLKRGLQALGCSIEVSDSGAQAWPAIIDRRVDAVVVDASSASANFEPWLLSEELRAVSGLPLILLIRAGRNHDRVRAYKAGADQCLTLPVSPQELAAALEAALKIKPVSGADGRKPPEGYADAEVQVDFKNHRICRDGKRIMLTRTEFKVLERLIRETGNVISVVSLNRAVWGPRTPQKKCGLLKVYISRLRRKIEADPRHPRYIISQRGLGYAFEPKNDGV